MENAPDNEWKMHDRASTGFDQDGKIENIDS
jgi:hypothetical protein